jgi:hypothetical protein
MTPAAGSPSLEDLDMRVQVIRVRSPRKGAVHVEQTERVCTRCGVRRPLAEFAVDRSRPSGRKGI